MQHPTTNIGAERQSSTWGDPQPLVPEPFDLLSRFCK